MTITPRQICFFLAGIAPVGKLILLPANLAATCGNDLLLPVLAHVLVQAVLVFCVLLLGRRERTLCALLRDACGKTAARIAACLLAAFLLFAAFVPVIEQKLLVRSTFYDTIPAYLVFTPFFLFAAYICARPLPTLGRLWDILAPLALTGMAGIALFSAGSADLGALSPAGAAGASGFLKGVQTACAWFFDAALLLCLIGRFPYRKGLALGGALCSLAGGGVLLLLLALFYGVFPGIAVIQTPAFSRMSGFFAGMTVLGRIDYFFIFAVAFAMTFHAALPVQCAVGLLTEAFGNKKYLAPALSVLFSALMLSAVYLVHFHTSAAVRTVTETLFWIFPLFTVLVPLLALLVFGRRHETLS